VSEEQGPEKDESSYDESLQKAEELGIDLRYIEKIVKDLETACTKTLKDQGAREIDALTALSIIVGARYAEAFEDIKFTPDENKVLEDAGIPEDLWNPAVAINTMADELVAGFFTLEAQIGPGADIVLPLAAAKYLTAALLKKTKSEES